MILKIQSSIDPGLLEKLRFWWNFWKKTFFSFFKYRDLRRKHIRKEYERAPALRVIRAETRLTVYRSLPHTKTIGKRKSRRPRTPVLLTMKNMFSKVIASWKCLWITIDYLSYVLRLWIEIVKPWIARAISEFYPVQVFLKVEILMRFSQKSIFRKYQDSKEK